MSRSKATRIAKQFGMVIDEGVTGNFGGCYMITIDHPTHSFGGDCRSIHVADYGSGDRSPSQCAWAEAIDRMSDECRFLEPCTDADCDYHSSFAANTQAQS
jgi:hypothetical protein